jgi:integrase
MAKLGPGKQFKIPVHGARRSLATEKGLGSIGWHTYRHTYRSLLSAEETPLDVQQKLMRHAHMSTTDYGGPPVENRRQAK